MSIGILRIIYSFFIILIWKLHGNIWIKKIDDIFIRYENKIIIGFQ